MSVCRSCKQPITWTATDAGKWMPVDAEPVPTGNVLLGGGNPPTARVLSGVSLQRARHAKCLLYRSHFATCPAARQHRKDAA